MNSIPDRFTKPRLLSRGLALAGLTLLAGGVISQAGTFETDFNGGIPYGVNLQGTAFNYDHSTGGVGGTGVLKLTDATASQQGGAILDDFDNGEIIGGFEVTFDLYIGSGNGADGMSFFFGDFADAAHAEEGPGTINGLTIAFDVYNSGGTPAEAPAIDLKWNNVIQLHRLVGAASTTTGAQPIGTATTIRTQTTSGGAPVYWPVKIRVDTDGTLDLAYNGQIVYTNVPIFRAISDFPISGIGARFGFGARTGGSYDNHWVDNLKITTFPLDVNSGQPHMVSCLPLALQNPTTGAPSSPVAGVMIDMKDWDYAIAEGSLTMTVNGTTVTPTLSRVDDVSRIIYRPASGYLAGGVNTIVVGYRTTSTPALNNSFTYSALVGTATALLPVYALPGVDTTKPGFKIKVHQMDPNRNPATGQYLNAERQIANGYIDPSTGQPFPNTALTDWLDSAGTVLASADADGFFTAEGVINWNQDAPTAVGNFTSANGFADQSIPGLTGNTGVNTTDRFVTSIETILELKAGGYRFGVNSDDGFRLSIGRAPGDVVGVQLGTAGDRSPVDSLMDVVIPADGLYPVRLMYFETSGSASCEFFFVDDNGVRWLVNDLTAPQPIKAYRESAATPPYISRALPAVGYLWSFADQDLVLDVTDGASPLKAGSAVLTLNGTPQTITESKDGKVTTLVRSSSMANLLPSGAVTAVLTYEHTPAGGATETITNTWTFSVPPYTRPIPVANKVSSSDLSGTGFHVRAHQIDRSRDANQGNGGRYTGQSGGAANMPRPEIQFANGYINRTNNTPYPNLAVAGPEADGGYELGDVLNWNSGAGGAAANAGIFNADIAVPGVPGGGSSGSTAIGLDNTVHEITTYLDLKAGAHILGVNVDDGWFCLSAPNPKDTLGTPLGWRNAPGGQNGNPLNNPNGAFTVLVLEEGIYPFRILFWQGGGGINLEFLSIDRNFGTQILVNDVTGLYPSTTANPNSVAPLESPIQAYSTYAGPVRPWTKFSVYPMPTHATLWQNTHQQSGPGPILVKVGAGNPVDIANDEPRFNQALVNWPFGDAIGAIVADLGGGSVGMVLDDVSVTPTVTPISGSTDMLVMYVPNPPLAPKSTHTAGLVYADTTNYWTFTVSDYVNVPASAAVPASAVDLNAPGFRVKVTQAAAARPGGNTVAAAEAQLAGTPASVAVPGPEADGSYIDADIINWNVTMNPGGTPAQIGNFQTLMTSQADEPVPGIPGTGLSGNPRFENITAEICAYLELPAGYQKFAVNGDDGWKVQIGMPGQTDGPVLFSRDRGAGARDIPFAFITPEAGFYPVRLVWYQGGGGGNVEFFTYGPDNTKILVNDRSNPHAVKAYVPSAVQPTVSITLLADGKVQVTFEGKLQQSSSVSPTNWQDVTGAVSPYEVAPTGTELYFRATR